MAESRKHTITAKLRQIPYLGPIRVALVVALIQTPHRFRTKRQLWADSGPAAARAMIDRYRERYGRRPKGVAADNTYGNGEMLRATWA